MDSVLLRRGTRLTARRRAANVRQRWRTALLFGSAAVWTGLVAILFADLLWRTGWWSPAGLFLLALFVVLTMLAAIGCMHAVVGFLARRLGDHHQLGAQVGWRARDLGDALTAIVIPVYNEDARRVFAALRATYESLRETGALERFEFFVLSDSNEPARWSDEERRWCELVHSLDAAGRIHYRRRLENHGKKSGNISEFLTTWGARYRYFVVMDADSVMRGDTLVALVRMMEVRPSAGVIQTAPALCNAESLFARAQQFTNRLYSPVFTAGLSYWSIAHGNYWGHNAIVRTAAFMAHCDLPLLPGPEPFGGPILSHDFVEAAFLLRAGWEAWTVDLDGSWEETPPGLIEYARRDRRWCQGNMQHGWMQFARGLPVMGRLHMLQGTFGYLGGPLWLAFVVTANWMLWWHQGTGLSQLTVRSSIPSVDLSGTGHALLMFLIVATILFLPRLLALLDLLLDPPRRRAFGGLRRAGASVLVETVLSTLLAPLFMLWHTWFVLSMVLGKKVQWNAQTRFGDGTSWSTAVRRHGWQTLLGLGWGTFNWLALPATFWWFAPMLLGMLLAIPLSVWTSRRSVGARARAMGLLLTPEETAPPPELRTLRRWLAQEAGPAPAPEPHAVARLILDPQLHRIHHALLHDLRSHPGNRRTLARWSARGWDGRALCERLLTHGPGTCSPEEQQFVLSDPDAVSWLHLEVWRRPPETLATDWREASAQLLARAASEA
jgi:membrane glycosyltransferase